MGFIQLVFFLERMKGGEIIGKDGSAIYDTSGGFNCCCFCLSSPSEGT